jgi:hypothetical protein
MVFRFFKWLLTSLGIWNNGPVGNGPPGSNDDPNLAPLPNYCLRGLRRPEWVYDWIEDGALKGKLVASEAFFSNRKTAANRLDQGFETSVNWEDNAEVELFTLNDKQNAQYGAARILTATIDEISKREMTVTGSLSCERKVLLKNPYHGNIVYAAYVPKPLEKQLGAAMAMRSKFVPPV